jgi:hypothetical protein
MEAPCPVNLDAPAQMVGEMLSGEHPFAHAHAHQIGIDDEVVEDIVQARQPRQGDRRAAGWGTELSDDIRRDRQSQSGAIDPE